MRLSIVRLPLLLLSLTILTLLTIAACQGPPPTVIYIVLSPTPDTITTTPGAVTAQDATTTSPTPNLSATPEITATPDVFPTVTTGQIQVAEQRFQYGRMFWLQPTNQIWVLIEDSTTPSTGSWKVYNDTFIDGQREFDPTFEPPDEYLQPVRGFGKLWRENSELRRTIGWAIEAEFGHVTAYEYRPGGTVNDKNEYVPAPGKHYLYSLYGDLIVFNEADNTWKMSRP